LIHFHAAVHLDAKPQADGDREHAPPPDGYTLDVLDAAIRAAVCCVEVPLPAELSRWSVGRDVRRKANAAPVPVHSIPTNVNHDPGAPCNAATSAPRPTSTENPSKNFCMPRVASTQPPPPTFPTALSRSPVIMPTVVPRDELLTHMCCAKDDGGWVATDRTGRTSIAGVWAAGNVTDPRAQVITAAGMWSAAAFAINTGLLDEDVDHAVEQRRATATVRRTETTDI
jgi:hypothetical protein